MMIPVKQIANGVKKFTIDNSPTILTAAAVAGVMTSAILAVRGTPKAMQYISEAESEQTEPLTYVDKVRLTWTCYVPALSVGAVTIACIVGANDINLRRNAALVSVFSITETAFSEYKSKMVETIGVNKEQKVRDTLAQEAIDRNPISGAVYITNKGDVLCYDQLSGRYFHSDMESLRRSENDIRELILNEGYVNLNEFYSKIGLPDNEFGRDVGWNSDKLLELTYSACLSEDNIPCISVGYSVAPTTGYHQFH